MPGIRWPEPGRARLLMRWRRSLWLCVVAVLVILGPDLLSARSGEAVADEFPPDVSNKIHAIMSSSSGPSAIARNLRRLGFPPDDPAFKNEIWNGFNVWPELRKLETAYYAAEEHTAGGGKALLKDVMMLSARQNPAITKDTAFVESLGDIGPAQVREFKPGNHYFGLPSPAHMSAPLPENMERMVTAVMEHLPHTPGGLDTMVRACCSIEPDKLYQRLRSASNREDVLRWALRVGEIPPELADKMARLLAHAARHNAALSYSDAFAEFSDEMRKLGLEPSSEVERRVAEIVRREAVTASPMQMAPERPLARAAEEIGMNVLPDTVQLLAQAIKPGGRRKCLREGWCSIGSAPFCVFPGP